MDKNLYEANIKLLDENKQVFRDIKTLIKYFTTEDKVEKENLEETAKEIINYYEGKKVR